MLHKRLRMTLAGIPVAVLVLTGCSPDGGTSGSRATSFKSSYDVARGALEAGNYKKALRSYDALIERAGPAAGRVRLEYAHTLLRADQYEQASLIARRSAAEQTGLAQASALSVQATADHQIALAAMDKGQYDRAVYDRLVASRTAFDQALQAYPELDTQGSLASRRREVANAEASLKASLGL